MASTIEKFRISEKNKIYTEIISVEKNIERLHQSNIALLSGTIKDRDFVKKSKLDNEKKIQDYTEKVVELKEKLEALNQGILDEEISKEVAKNTDKAVKAIEDMKKKTIQDKKTKKENTKKMQDDYKSFKDSDFSFRQKVYEMNKGYERFKSIELPSYMQDNLTNMPNNKGYIFRGVWFFGELPASGYPIVMFENRQGIKIIHEIFKDKHFVYSKEGDRRKVLIEEITRIQKK